ncbi:MAG: Eco29kI family restriction endonuclease [Planctomycetota bacterium]|nr:Eco29kI family restriction endonuclease [Planctomycetota bacterium]
MAKRAKTTEETVQNSIADDPHAFRFDLDRAIRDQVVEKLEASPKLPLSKRVGPQKSGIYVLYFKNELVYVGKASKETTKSGRTLRARLDEHAGKIGKRENISLVGVSCRFLTFESEWWVVAAEFALITLFAPAWNYSGFGSKVAGIGRPGTGRISDWDSRFPPLAT